MSLGPSDDSGPLDQRNSIVPGCILLFVECVIERTMDAIFASAQRSVLRGGPKRPLLLRWKPTAQIKIPMTYGTYELAINFESF